jgi:hypothetical protein
VPEATQERTPAPSNFITFLGDTLRTARGRFFPILLLFIFGDLISIGLTSIIFRDVGDSSDGIRLVIESGVLALDIAITGTLGIWASRLWIAGMGDESVDFKAGLQTSIRRFGSIVVVCLLAALLSLFFYLGFGASGLLILGFMLAIPLSAGPPILLHVVGLEDRSIREAFPRFRGLLKGQGLRMFVYLLLLGLMATLVSNILVQLVGVGVLQVGLSGGSLTAAGVVLGTVFLGISDLLLSAGLLVAYVDARKREDEDFSIDELTEAQ